MATEYNIFKHDPSSQSYSVYNHVQFEHSNAIFFFGKKTIKVSVDESLLRKRTSKRKDTVITA